MAEPSLKIVPDAPATAEGAPIGRRSWRLSRGKLRLILLVVLPLIALAIGTVIYLGSGRYITTDNAYVGAPKVLITPDISGKISRVMVREGQTVQEGETVAVLE